MTDGTKAVTYCTDPLAEFGEGVLLQDLPQVDGRVADGRREGDRPVIVWIVFSADDRGKKCDIRERVWQAHRIVLDSATQGGKFRHGCLLPVEKRLEESSELPLLVVWDRQSLQKGVNHQASVDCTLGYNGKQYFKIGGIERTFKERSLE